MPPEVLPLSVRGTAMGVAIFLHWGANFAVSQTFPIMLSAWGPGAVFLGYAAVSVIALVFVQALVTETRAGAWRRSRRTRSARPEGSGGGMRSSLRRRRSSPGGAAERVRGARRAAPRRFPGGVWRRPSHIASHRARRCSCG